MIIKLVFCISVFLYSLYSTVCIYYISFVCIVYVCVCVSERCSLQVYLSGICLDCGQACFMGSSGKHLKHRLNL